jgi:hypothetical protein
MNAGHECGRQRRDMYRQTKESTMTAPITRFASVLFAGIAFAASAQTQPTQPAPSASTPMAGSMMSHDCAKSMAKHDHGAEKGMPRPLSMSAPCAGDAAASAPAKSDSATKKQLTHDHSTFHKTI